MSARKGVAQASHKRSPRRDMTWQEHAKCADPDIDPRIFDNPNHFGQALIVCRGCPVQMACRQFGQRSEGVWGGRIHKAKKSA